MTHRIIERTAAARFARVLELTGKAVDEGRGYELHAFTKDGMFCATLTIEPAQVTP